MKQSLKLRNIIYFALRIGSERFRELEKFKNMVKELGISKSTIIFKINVMKLKGKYPKLKKCN